MADHEKAARPVSPAKRWVILPCVELPVQAERLATLRTCEGLSVLPVSLASTLPLRTQGDHPDAIVMVAGDAFPAWIAASAALQDVFAGTPTLLLVEKLGPGAVRNAARMHIHSVLPVTITAQQLEAALTATIAGFAVSLPRLPSAPLDLMAGAEHLTVREVEVLRLMARGQRNKQMAARLNISEHTVKFHVSSVLGKLGARTRTEAVTIGMTRGLVAI